MGRKLTIYPDTYFYGRPFDQPTPIIKAEAETVRTILKLCKTSGHLIIGSAMVSFEIRQIPDTAARKMIEAYYTGAIVKTVPAAPRYPRAEFFATQGLGEIDAIHLATAENAGADFLLTVDRDFTRISMERKLSTVKVMNPLIFLKGGFI